ncbi:hypothetical protein C2E23DRAFT_899363, partial [Lenzites betulinus]
MATWNPTVSRSHGCSARGRIPWTSTSAKLSLRTSIWSRIPPSLSAGAARHAPQSGLPGRGRRHTLPASPRLTPGNNTEYRRFQIAFESGNSASAFIESIRFICPCKANAPPPPPRGARIS